MDFNSFIDLTSDQAGLVKKLTSLPVNELPWLESETKAALGTRNFPSPSPDQIIEQIFPRNLGEYEKKAGNATYWSGNLACFKEVVKALIDPSFVASISGVGPSHETVVYNYASLLDDLLFDAADALSQLRALKGLAPFPLRRNPMQHTAVLYHAINSIIFGQVSFHSFRDRETAISTTLLRQVLELRIRSALNVAAVYDSRTKSYSPIPISFLMDRMAEEGTAVQLPVPITHLRRINDWSNIYVHGGVKFYTWHPLFAMQYMKVLVLGKPPTKRGWSIDSGIQIKEGVIERVHAAVLKSVAPKRRLRERVCFWRPMVNPFQIVTFDKPHAEIVP